MTSAGVWPRATGGDPCRIQTTRSSTGGRFSNKAAGVVAGSAFASSALSYDRVLGANDRIALGHIGVGNRGSGLHMMTSRLKDKSKVETVAVCDLWKNNRERAVANSEQYYGRAQRAFQYLEELLALKDVDAVLIATPEHSHSPVLKATVDAGKDAYCEKPMGNVLADVKAARDAVKKSNRIVQVGTQHRSEPYQWMSHGIDLVHFFMNDQPPRSIITHGGIYAWHDGRKTPTRSTRLSSTR